MVTIARPTQAETVAEYVEDAAILAVLEELQVDWIQASTSAAPRRCSPCHRCRHRPPRRPDRAGLTGRTGRGRFWNGPCIATAESRSRRGQEPAMAENEDGQERTEQPSEKRLREARENGNLPRSRELATAAVFGAGVVGLRTTGSSLAHGAQDWLRGALNPDPALLRAPELLFGYMGTLLLKLLWVMLPLVGLSLLAAFVAPLAMGTLHFSGKSLMPDLGRLNPLSGLKRTPGARRA